MATSMQKQGKIVSVITAISGIIGVPLGLFTLQHPVGLLGYISIPLISITAIGVFRIALYLDQYFPEKPKESIAK